MCLGSGFDLGAWAHQCQAPSVWKAVCFGLVPASLDACMRNNWLLDVQI